MSSEVLFLLMLLAVALFATVAVELLVARAFRVGRQGLIAVLGVNLITNPLFNLCLLLVAYALGVGGSDWAPHGWLLLPVTAILEVVVVALEWRILMIVAAGTWGTSRRLLTFSIVANLASALAPAALWLLLNLVLVALQPLLWRV